MVFPESPLNGGGLVNPITFWHARPYDPGTPFEERREQEPYRHLRPYTEPYRPRKALHGALPAFKTEHGALSAIKDKHGALPAVKDKHGALLVMASRLLWPHGCYSFTAVMDTRLLWTRGCYGLTAVYDKRTPSPSTILRGTCRHYRFYFTYSFAKHAAVCRPIPRNLRTSNLVMTSPAIKTKGLLHCPLS